MEFRRLRDALLAVAQPYSNLYHPDGSLYMERFIVKQRHDEGSGHIRLHHIVTKDWDDHLHDHPFSFWSFVLTGGYLELRPVIRNPCFIKDDDGKILEECRVTQRYAGALDYRHACDRHKIVRVEPNTWTLVFAGPLRQWWGFYTPKGKVHHRHYESAHSESARIER